MTNPAMERLRKNLDAILVKAKKNNDQVLKGRKLPEGVQGPELPSSSNVRGKKEGLAHAREGHSGRRGDILEDFHNKTGMYKDRADDALPPVMLKVSIAGSGCEVWMSHADKDGVKDDVELMKLDAPSLDGWFSDKAPAAYANDKGDVTFSGPQTLGGTSDTGKNSINNLVDTVPPIIIKSIPKGYETGENVILLMKAHSRGAVAASMIAKRIKAKLPKMKVELTQFDPVPGQANYGEKSEIAIGDHTVPEHEVMLDPDGIDTRTIPEEDVSVEHALDETALVYSLASGYGYLLRSFQPQIVHGAKRIIISRQNHGGGLVKGYLLGDKKYKGSQLNSLPPGAYYEKEIKKDGDHNVGVIERMSKDDFMEKLDLTYKKAVSKLSDWGRYDIVKGALEEFFTRNP